MKSVVAAASAFMLAALTSAALAKGEVKSLSFSPDGTRIAVAVAGSVASIFDVDTGNRLATLPKAEQVAFGSDGTKVYFADRKILSEYDVQSTDVIQFAGATGGLVALEASPNGKFLASSAADGATRIWRISKKTLQLQIPGSQGSGSGISISSNSREIWSATASGYLSVFSVTTGDPVRRTRRIFEGLSDIYKLPKNEPLLATYQYLKSYDAKTLGRLRTTPIAGYRIAVSGDLVALCGRYGVQIVKLPKLHQLYHEIEMDDYCWTAELSPSGQILAVGEAAGIVSLYSTETFERLRTLTAR